VKKNINNNYNYFTLFYFILFYTSPQPKRHIDDRFSRFCRAHYCGRQTDRQTDRGTTLLGL